MGAAKILIVHPSVSVARDYIDYPYFTDLGAVQLASVLSGEGFDVTLVDAYALPGSGLREREDGRLLMGAELPEILAQSEGDFDAIVVAYTPFHRPPHRDDVLSETLAGLRAQHPEARLLLADLYQSGQHYVEAPGEQVLAAYPEAHAYVKYEAELTLPALLRGMKDGDAPRGVQIGERPPQLDALPPPAWASIDLDAHDTFLERVVRNLGRGPWAFPVDGRTLPMVTSRGCPYRCIHCSSNPDRAPGEAKTQRRLGEEALRAQLGLLSELGVTRVEVLDELLNVSERHFDYFLDQVEAFDLRFDVPNGLRADYLELRHLERMRGRVNMVSVSAESGSERVLDEVVDKRMDLTRIREAAEHAKDAGVPLMIHFMIGLPGETAKEINQTLEFALELWDEHGAWPAVQYATPLPGTRLAEGRTLPVVQDWGPAFQKVPEAAGSVAPAQLELFMNTFQQRLRQSMGPKKLIMNVTYICNNHCTFCAVGTRTQVDGHPERQREFLDKYRQHGVTMVDFDGGEPTLNPELIPLIKHARRIGYERINVTTNGRLAVYEGFAKKLVRSGLTTLLFSVHGPNKRIHSSQVGVPEAFEQTVKGIENCLGFAPRGVELGMNITLTKGNFRSLGDVAQLAYDLGLRWLNVQFLTPFGRATKLHAPDTAEAAAVTREVIDAWKERMKVQVINLPWCFLPGYDAHLEGDLGKLTRHMIFVNNETVNLANYLAERREKKEVCEGCPHACFCGGFYNLEDAPEPEWLVTPESLVREVESEMQVR
ncbi:MAG: radical SAM protein [Deltaproteobacteria bacterium]|nr:radical SAM protein [Deltaproteobacteria bacterium]